MISDYCMWKFWMHRIREGILHIWSKFCHISSHKVMKFMKSYTSLLHKYREFAGLNNIKTYKVDEYSRHAIKVFFSGKRFIVKYTSRKYISIRQYFMEEWARIFRSDNKDVRWKSRCISKMPNIFIDRHDEDDFVECEKCWNSLCETYRLYPSLIHFSRVVWIKTK